MFLCRSCSSSSHADAPWCPGGHGGASVGCWAGALSKQARNRQAADEIPALACSRSRCHVFRNVCLRQPLARRDASPIGLVAARTPPNGALAIAFPRQMTRDSPLHERRDRMTTWRLDSDSRPRTRVLDWSRERRRPADHHHDILDFSRSRASSSSICSFAPQACIEGALTWRAHARRKACAWTIAIGAAQVIVATSRACGVLQPADHAIKSPPPAPSRHCGGVGRLMLARGCVHVRLTTASAFPRIASIVSFSRSARSCVEREVRRHRPRPRDLPVAGEMLADASGSTAVPEGQPRSFTIQRDGIGRCVARGVVDSHPRPTGRARGRGLGTGIRSRAVRRRQRRESEGPRSPCFGISAIAPIWRRTASRPSSGSPHALAIVFMYLQIPHSMALMRRIKSRVSSSSAIPRIVALTPNALRKMRSVPGGGHGNSSASRSRRDALSPRLAQRIDRRGLIRLSVGFNDDDGQP